MNSKLLSAVMLIATLAGCAGAPSFPDPKPGEGQIVVELRGEPREGVTGPARESVIGDYEIKNESVEKGKAFERVDYDELHDVVVVLDAPVIRGTSQQAPTSAALIAGEGGFDHAQLLLGSAPSGISGSRARLTISNQRDVELNFFAFSDTDQFFELSVKPGGKGEVSELLPGVYEVMCEEDESLLCLLYVTNAPMAWIGSSDEYPFFNGLEPGKYDLRVYPPRLPAWTQTVNVAAGKRTKVTAELTVNDLPKAE